jgi:hypothetical protein
MGKSATSTLNDIEETRHRLEKDVAELTERLPAPAIWAKRLIGLAVGGGVGGSAFWFVVHRIRSKRKDRKVKEPIREKAPQQAVSPVVQVIPADWGKSLEKLFESGEWKGPALAIGGVWLVLKLSELRRLRRLTRAMMAGR